MASMTPAYALQVVCTKRPFGEEYQKRPGLRKRVAQVKQLLPVSIASALAAVEHVKKLVVPGNLGYALQSL
jgi:hypothetical protein